MRMFVTLVLAILVTSAYAEKSKGTGDDVQQLSPVIYDVKGMGNWQKGSRSGQVRLVITRLQKQDEVFLQWVQWDAKGPELVKSTVAIKEIAQQGRFKVDFIRRENKGNERKIILGLENLHDKSSSRVVIQVQDLGVYSCKFE
ncbi:MAG: hypothetical protein ACI8SR_001562 [Oceanicoccus sp.]|jgi:hypothetical protein